MKKHIVIPFGICFLFIALSGYYLYTRYTAQIDVKKELLEMYTTEVKSKMEVITTHAMELPYIVSPIVGKGGVLNTDTSAYTANLVDLESFYIEHNYFIKGISVYDMHGDVFNIYRDRTGEFIYDPYKSRVINVLRSEMNITTDKNSISLVLPVFQGSALVGNVAVNLDIENMQQALNKKYIEKGDVWPSSVLDEETILTLPVEGEWELTKAQDILQRMHDNVPGFVSGKIKGKESTATVISYYERLPVAEYFLGLVFSYNISPVIFSHIFAFAFVCLALIGLAAAVAFILNRMIIRSRAAIKEKVQQIDMMQAIYRNTPVGIMVSKQNMFYTGNNSLFRLLDEYVSPDYVGKNIGELAFPSCFSGQNNQDEHKDSDLCTFERNGKEITLDRRQANMELDGNKVTIDAFWDVTDLEHSRKDALRSEIAKSELLSRVSTDFQKTLTSIRDAVVLLQQQHPDDQHITYIKELSSNLSELIDSVQDYADIEAGRVILDEMSFNVVEELKKVADTYHSEIATRDIDLQIHFSSSSIRNLVGDPQRFRQVLHELLSNAIKATQSGSIRISLDTTALQGGKVQIKCSVEDTGTGMTKQKLKSLFSLDLRAKEKGDSLGLGVIIAKKLVNIMGGSIRATSPSPISTSPDAPGMQFTFVIQCYSDQPFDKQLDYSSIVSYNQVKALIITSDTHQVQYLDNYMSRKGIQADKFVYNKDSAELLINKLIIDKGRYQMIIIDTANSATTFTIATEINRNDLTGQCLYVLIDTYTQKGNYVKAKSLYMDYYFAKSEDLSVFDNILKNHFVNLSEENGMKPELLRKDIQILIAENNTLSQTVAKVIFKQLGYEVDLVQNALSLINELNHKTYDIIFIDLKFPPTDGFEIADILRKKGYQTPIIAMTSTLTRENLKHISDSGINGYIPKPLNLDSVKKILFKWIV